MAVMRNYKARLIDENLHVDLEKLEECINKEKSYNLFKPYINYLLKNIPDHLAYNMFKFIGKTNSYAVSLTGKRKFTNFSREINKGVRALLTKYREKIKDEDDGLPVKFKD